MDTFSRQVDKMGRLVIPKEIRETLKLNGENLEIRESYHNKGLEIVKTKKTGNHVKQLDRYGRILIPAEQRERMNWYAGHKLDVTIVKGNALLKGEQEGCTICGKTESLIPIKNQQLCQDCMEEAQFHLIERWQSYLMKIKNQYMKKCEESADQRELGHYIDAKSIGRKLLSLLEFLSVKEHSVVQSLAKADQRLEGYLVNVDVLKGLKQQVEKVTDDKRAAVYQDLIKELSRKQDKQETKLSKKLPSSSFESDWTHLKEGILQTAISSLQKEHELYSLEQQVTDGIAEYQTLRKDSNLDLYKWNEVVYQIRGTTSKLLFVMEALQELYGVDLSKKISRYQSLYSSLHDVSGWYEWIEQLSKHRRDLDVKKKHVKTVKKEWVQEWKQATLDIELS